MMNLYRLFDDDADLPDNGLLAVEMRNPDEKPRIRLVPVTDAEIQEMAYALWQAEQMDEYRREVL